jgi:lysophospholipase L1-like esterase
VARVSPDCRVLLLALLPHRVSAWTARQARRVNAALADADWGDARVVFLDVGSALLSAGRLDASLYCDHLLDPPVPFLLHPNAEGQRRIASAMEPTLATMLAGAAEG